MSSSRPRSFTCNMEESSPIIASLLCTHVLAEQLESNPADSSSIALVIRMERMRCLRHLISRFSRALALITTRTLPGTPPVNEPGANIASLCASPCHYRKTAVTSCAVLIPRCLPRFRWHPVADMFESSYVFETNDAAPQDEHKRATTNQNSEDENLTESSNRSGKERSSESQRNSTNLQLSTAEVQTVVGADDSSITIQELLATSDTTGSIADKRGHEDKSEESDESVSGVENKVDSKFSGEEHSTTTVIHQEYHIDLSALSDADLAAVRSHLDDMFSEFDSRGSGALQQDDVRRLILQWAAEPDGNIK